MQISGCGLLLCWLKCHSEGPNRESLHMSSRLPWSTLQKSSRAGLLSINMQQKKVHTHDVPGRVCEHWLKKERYSLPFKTPTA